MSKCGREYRKNSGQKSGFIAASGARFSDKSLLSRSKKAMSKNPIFFINFLDVSDNSKTKKIIFFKFQKFFCRNYFFIFSKNFSTKIFLPCFDSKIFDLKHKNTLISVKILSSRSDIKIRQEKLLKSLKCRVLKVKFVNIFIFMKYISILI